MLPYLLKGDFLVFPNPLPSHVFQPTNRIFHGNGMKIPRSKLLDDRSLWFVTTSAQCSLINRAFRKISSPTQKLITEYLGRFLRSVADLFGKSMPLETRLSKNSSEGFFALLLVAMPANRPLYANCQWIWYQARVST